MAKRETSIATYREIEAKGLLPKLRFEIYAALYRHGPCTAGELYQKIDWSIKGSVSARLSELRDAGCVDDIGVSKCKFSGQSALLWDVNKRLPVKVVKKKLPNRQSLIELLVASYDELRVFHDTIFKKMVNGYELPKVQLVWLAKLRDLMTGIEKEIDIKAEKKKK